MPSRLLARSQKCLLDIFLTLLPLAKKLNYGSIILLGHEKYYPKFGYKMIKNYGIKLPFDVPDENCMLIELTENALENVHGMVEYPKEFYE